MKNPPNHFSIIVYSVLLCLCLPITCFGDSKFPNQAAMDKALKKAEYLMTARRGDKVLVITKPLLKQLQKEGRYNTPFGLRVQNFKK